MLSDFLIVLWQKLTRGESQKRFSRGLRIKVLLRKSHRRGLAYQPSFSYFQIFFSWLGSFAGICILSYLSVYSHYPLIAAPFGASAVLIFGLPESPLAQPRNLFVGNFWGALVAICCVHFFGSAPWVMALAVSTTITLMKLTRSVHPPSGAVALVGVMSGASWHFIFTPVLVGSLIILVWTYLFSNFLAPGRSYPKHWF